MTMQNAECRMQKARSLGLFLSAFCILHFAFAGEASADIVVFKNGRTMSASGVRVVADLATLSLRSGGEMTFPANIIERVDPDEVPYPEPNTATAIPVEAAPQPPPVSDAALAARPFAELISSVAARHEMDARLVHAVIEQESNYQPRARSRKGARGLMQLMPATARQYGVTNSYDPKSNLEAGIRHLKDLMTRLDLPVALAAYNAGEGTVQRYRGLPPYPETQAYVRNILRRLGRAAGN
jgi:soluble lytic murein transglycosylase-like protein